MGRTPAIVQPLPHFSLCLIVAVAWPVVADADNQPAALPDKPSADAQEFTALVRDNDGRLSLKEFLAPRPFEQWRDAGTRFYRSDVDADGRLSLDEFVQRGKGERRRPDVVFTRVEQVLQNI